MHLVKAVIAAAYLTVAVVAATAYGPPTASVVPEARIISTVPEARIISTVPEARIISTVPEARIIRTATALLPVPRVTPNPSAPGTATTFDVFCGSEAKSATLFGNTLGLADLILMHSTATTMAGEFVVTVTLPTSITSGSYHPDFDCSNGFAGSATLRVDPVPRQAPATGDGTTATQAGSVLEPIGYVLMGLGVLTAAIALRRRGFRSPT